MTATTGATVLGSGRCAVMSADPLLAPVEGVAVAEAETGEMVLAVVGVLVAGMGVDTGVDAGVGMMMVVAAVAAAGAAQEEGTCRAVSVVSMIATIATVEG